MVLLPIIERELRVAARKRSTFWLRVVAALVSMVIGSGLMLLTMAGAFATATLGGVLFSILTWLACGVALSAGLFFTSDCLSEEKREGTLGFLFLTDLRGYDVAGGKLLATSLRGSFALLAVFPILAITLLMGGVTGVQFWQTTLALMNALFCSLAAGLFISAISRDPQKAMAGTLFLLVLWLGGGPLADAILAAAKGHPFKPVFSLASPFYVFTSVSAWGRAPFWRGLLISQGIAWLLLALASVLVPRTWQERRAARSSFSNTTWSYAWRYGSARRRAGLRRKLLGRNPVLWLACRERWQSVGVWGMAMLVAGVLVALLVTDVTAAEWVIWSSMSWVFVWLLYLWAASQACRFFIEARRSGLIELLLATPVSVPEIVQGQWRALLRMFGVPVVLLLAVQLAGVGFGGKAAWGQVASQTGNQLPALAIALLSSGASVVTSAASLVAISWFGMWMGMTSKSNNLATLKTIAFVQVIPGFVISFASMLVIPVLIMPALLKGGLSATNAGSRVTSALMTWFPLVSIALSLFLHLAKDIGFFVWSRRTLYRSFREQATRTLVPVRPAAPPRVPPPIPAPPVMPLQP
jgi:hypothetical protein